MLYYHDEETYLFLFEGFGNHIQISHGETKDNSVLGIQRVLDGSTNNSISATPCSSLYGLRD